MWNKSINKQINKKQYLSQYPIQLLSEVDKLVPWKFWYFCRLGKYYNYKNCCIVGSCSTMVELGTCMRVVAGSNAAQTEVVPAVVRS